MRLICFYSQEKRSTEHFKGTLFWCTCICTVVKGGDMRFHKELYLVILGTFLYFTLVLNERRELEGYNFPVFSTPFCPRNESEWKKRSAALNCNRTNGFTCLPNQQFTELLEFCYTQPKILIEAGTCLYLVKRVSKVNGYRCHHFRNGCHNASFLSDRIYKYPDCISLGNGCFLAEPSCERGYTTLNPDTGMASWYGDVLKKPTLPIMDIYGDVIGTDGHNLVMFESDGKIVKPQIDLGDKLYPTYSLTLSEETGIIAIVSRQGLLVTYESNGVPHAAIQFRAEEQRTNGTFLPVAPPVVSGHRIYILTEFRPDYDTQQPNILGMQRLFAIDIRNALDGRLAIAWVYNFENLDPVLPLVSENYQEKRGTSEENRVVSTFGPAPQIMINTDTNMVYVNLPPPEAATNAPHLLWGFKDEVNGTSPSLIFKIPQSLSNFAMFESNSAYIGADKLKKIDLNNSFKLSKNAGEASIWGVSMNKKQILKLSPEDGTVVEQINLDSVLNMTSSTVTSKLIVARSSESSQDILIFGVQASSSNTDDSVNSTNNNSKMTSTQNYVVSLIEKTVSWAIKTPNNREVKGQIAGIRRSSVNEADMLVVYTSDSEESEIFGITSY